MPMRVWVWSGLLAAAAVFGVAMQHGGEEPFAIMAEP